MLQSGRRWLRAASRLGHVSASSAKYSSFAVQEWLNEYMTSADKIKTIEGGLNTGLLKGTSDDKANYVLTDVLTNMKGGTTAALDLRGSVRTMLSKNGKDSDVYSPLNSLEGALRSYLGVAFSVSALEFRRITFEESTGQMLEWVAAQDAVLNKIRSLRELRKRLGDGRRCYALFHPDFSNQPVAFIHVALSDVLAPSLKYLDDSVRESSDPKYAMFYSVNAPFKELVGLDIATKIIKLAVDDIQKTVPSVKTFSTLSPVPFFLGWFNKTIEKVLSGAFPDTELPKLPSDLNDLLVQEASSRGVATWKSSDVVAPMVFLNGVREYVGVMLYV